MLHIFILLHVNFLFVIQFTYIQKLHTYVRIVCMYVYHCHAAENFEEEKHTYIHRPI